MDKREKLKELSQKVAISNEIIQKARYELGKTEQKVLLYMVSKIKPLDFGDEVYTFNAKNCCEVCNFNTDGGWYSQTVKEIMVNLKTKPIIIPLGGRRKLITSWFNDAVIDEETGEFKITFSKILMPYLYELKKNYTSFALEYVVAMKSEYGIRLYEYLKSVVYQGIVNTISLEEFREKVGCEGKYTQSSDLRARVIEPALKDINDFSDLKVSYKFIKTGKKVSHIEFMMLTPRDLDLVVRTAKRADELDIDLFRKNQPI